MQTTASRFTRIGDWVFEVKMVRALKVKDYGQPYSSVATITLNGDNGYIDTQMSRIGEDFNREDFFTFYNFCQHLEMKQVSYDKIRQGIRIPRTVDIRENQRNWARVQLVK